MTVSILSEIHRGEINGEVVDDDVVDDGSGVFHRCVAGLILVRGREISCFKKVEMFGTNTIQGKETVYLVGNRGERIDTVN